MNVTNFREFVTRFREKATAERFAMEAWFKSVDGADFVACALLDGKLNKQWALEQFREDCGTAACIAGWCAYLFDLPLHGYAPKSSSQEFLGLSPEEANHIFMGYWARKAIHEITYDEALDYLERCLEAEEILAS